MAVVKLFAGSFAPVGYLFCDGSSLPIMENQALFSILGTTFGGDGVKTFSLPNLKAPEINGDGTIVHYIICNNGIYPARP